MLVIIRQNKKSAKVGDLEMGNDLEIPFSGSIEKSIIDDELGAENRSRLSKALSQLSARQREAIYLKYHKNLQYEDVAEIMNINYQSVRNLHYAYHIAFNARL